MKKTKIIIPALGMLLLSTAASVTGTVAWFSANNRVNVNGMKVSTQVKGNLLIAAGSTNNSSDAVYSTADYESSTSSGILEPVSSVNGIDFYYTKEKVSGTGATTDTLLETYSTDTIFANYYEVTDAKAFVDYAFYVKATSDVANQKVIISKFNLLYNGSAIGEEKAWRAAVFAQTVEESTSAAALASGQLKSIVAPAASAASLYFTSGQAYSTAGTADPYAAAAKAEVSNLSAAANIGLIATKGSTQRYYVVVRLFLEGEDKTCNNETYAELTEEYTLNLTCELSTSDGAGQFVSQAAAIATPASGKVASVVKATSGLNDDLVAYQWEKYNGSSWSDISGQTTASLAAQTAGDVVRCKVTTQHYGVYYSNPVTLAETVA